MDRLDALRLFVRVVECGSFSAAARETGVGQPAVSKQIAGLEEHLGAQLVQRSSRRMIVTDAGRTFYESARRLVDDLAAAESLVGRGQATPAGLVRVATAPAFGRLYVVPLLPAFFARHPEISVELSASERTQDLVADGIDLAIRNGRLADSTLVARQVANAPVVTVATPAYLAARGEPRTPHELGAHSCIVFAPQRESRPWTFHVDGVEQAHLPRGDFRSADAEQVRAGVLAGLGIAHGPQWLFGPELASGAVVSVLRAFQPPPHPISLVHPGGRRVASKVRVLMDFLAQALSTNLQIS